MAYNDWPDDPLPYPRKVILEKQFPDPLAIQLKGLDQMAYLFGVQEERRKVILEKQVPDPLAIQLKGLDQMAYLFGVQEERRKVILEKQVPDPVDIKLKALDQMGCLFGAQEERQKEIWRQDMETEKNRRRESLWYGHCLEEARRRGVSIYHVAGPVPDWFRV